MDNRYYYVHPDAIEKKDLNVFIAQMTSLVALSGERLKEELFLKHESLLNSIPVYISLFRDYSQESAAIITFIEQLESIGTHIVNDALFEALYPKTNVGFLGGDFSQMCGIDVCRQVTDTVSLQQARAIFYKERIKDCDDNSISYWLNLMYPLYSFKGDALEDLCFWKNKRSEYLETIYELLTDIPEHPYTGGKGKTEALRGSKNASKRITGGDRVLYQLQGDAIIIHRCRGHYK